MAYQYDPKRLSPPQRAASAPVGTRPPTRTTGQEDFRPGGSADPRRVGTVQPTGYNPNNLRPPAGAAGQKQPNQPPLPNYGGVAPGQEDYSRQRARQQGDGTTMDVTPWEAARGKERMQSGGIEAQSQPYNPQNLRPPAGAMGQNQTQGGPASEFQPGGRFYRDPSDRAMVQPQIALGTNFQPGFLGGTAGQVQPPQANNTVSYQGQTQGGTSSTPTGQPGGALTKEELIRRTSQQFGGRTYDQLDPSEQQAWTQAANKIDKDYRIASVPPPQQPTWNPNTTGDMSRQWLDYQRQLNEYNNYQATGQTREQAQAETDRL